MNPSDVAARFRAIPTGNISDALIDLGITGRSLHRLRPLHPGQPAYAGWAFTVQQRQKSDRRSPGRTRHAEVIDQLANPGSVIVIDVAGREDVCSLGALLARRGHARGLAGFVVNGAVRDSKEIGDINFPVHSVGTSPQKSSVELETESVGEPITISDCTVETGDLIVADDTGVLCIPQGDVERVLEAAERIKVMEEHAAVLIVGGTSLFDALTAGRTFADQ